MLSAAAVDDQSASLITVISVSKVKNTLERSLLFYLCPIDSSHVGSAQYRLKQHYVVT